MIEINDKIETLLIMAAKNNGLDPAAIMCEIEEQLNSDEAHACEEFLKWLVKKKKTYGYNIRKIWAQWLASKEC